MGTSGRVIISSLFCFPLPSMGYVTLGPLQPGVIPEGGTHREEKKASLGMRYKRNTGLPCYPKVEHSNETFLSRNGVK